MTIVLIITMRRSMLIFITFKLTTRKKTDKCFTRCYFEKHSTALFINRKESTLLGELLFEMIIHTIEMIFI